MKQLFSHIGHEMVGSAVLSIVYIYDACSDAMRCDAICDDDDYVCMRRLHRKMDRFFFQRRIWFNRFKIDSSKPHILLFVCFFKYKLVKTFIVGSSQAREKILPALLFLKRLGIIKRFIIGSSMVHDNRKISFFF